MIIGIDASRSINIIQKTGVEKVSDELLKQFIKLKTQNSKLKNNDFNFVFYTPRKIDWLPKESQRVLNWPFKYLWTQIRLAGEILCHPPDIIFFPVHTIPLLLVTNYKLQITKFYKIIHDIAFKKEPRVYSFWQRIYLHLDLCLAGKLCQKIIVPTQAVKNDLLEYTKIKAEKVVVVPYGYNRQQRTVNKRLTTKKKQVLYIGRLEEKKNIVNLIKGFEIFHKTHLDYKLILAGKITNYQLPITNYDYIQYLGYVSEEKKHKLLRESACLVLVSQEEGFGFPLLEGFDFELPVIASDIPVLKEVGGDACFYVNPDSPNNIACGLERITQNRYLHDQLITKGRERLKKFTWPNTTQEIIKILVG